MKRFRQGSMAGRLAIGVIAIYCLILQSFALGAAPAFAEDVICTQLAKAPGKDSAPASHHHHGLCCVLACAASGWAYTGTSSPADIVAPRRISRAIFLPVPPRPERHHLKYHFAARGPPQTL